MTNSTTLSIRNRFLGYGACALAGSLWGMGFFFGKIALREMSVEHMVLYRFLFASLGILPIACTRERFRPTGKELTLLLISAALGIPIQFLVQFHGLALTTVSHASLMVGSMPVLLALTAILFTKERLDFLGWLALTGSTIGVALIVLGGKHNTASTGEPTLIGDLLVVLSLILALGWIMLSKKLMQTHGPPMITAYSILAGTLMLVTIILGPDLFAPLLHHASDLPPLTHVSPKTWAALAASGLLCTATTTFLWNWGIHHVPASRAGVFLNIEPALGSWLGVQLLGEQLGPHAVIGGILILIAAVILTTRGHESEPAMILE